MQTSALKPRGGGWYLPLMAGTDGTPGTVGAQGGARAPGGPGAGGAASGAGDRSDLDREEEALNELMRERIHAALADPRPDVPAEDVFARLRAYHEERVRGGGDA